MDNDDTGQTFDQRQMLVTLCAIFVFMTANRIIERRFGLSWWDAIRYGLGISDGTMAAGIAIAILTLWAILLWAPRKGSR